MTVGIGLVCKEGVLVAADSMGSSEATASRSSIKVRTLGQLPLVWTAAGSVFTMEEVTEALEKISGVSPDKPIPPNFLNSNPNPLRAQLKGVIQPAMKRAYQSALSSTPVPDGVIHPNFVADFLVLGMADGVPWFLEFARDGQINWHTSARFYAVGSGGPFATVAQALMSHYMTEELTLEQAKLLAYRTVETTIEVSPGGVGLPVQIAVCDSDGSRVLDPTELSRIEVGVARWKELERESLGEAFAGSAEAVGDLPLA